MKLIATADLHLKASEPERLSVFEWVLRQVVERDADGLLIAGDLFDSDAEASRQVSDVKRLLDDRISQSTPVVMVAGNHDPGLARLGWHGPVRVLQPHEHLDLPDPESATGVRIHGLPYQRGVVVSDLEKHFALDETVNNILLGHVSYLSPQHPHIVEAIKEHGEANECLLYESDIQGIPFDHVLLGHWHGQQSLGGEPPVTYVGSTVPNSRREEGPKHILEATISDGRVDMAPLSVEHPPGWFYATRTYDWLPHEEEQNVEELYELVADAALPGCVLQVRIRGYTQFPLEGLRGRIREALGPLEEQCRRLEVDDSELAQAEAFDHPLVERALAELEAVHVSPQLMDAIKLNQDPQFVRERMESVLQEQPEAIRSRAKRRLLQALHEELRP